jgi:hypothetical protein
VFWKSKKRRSQRQAFRRRLLVEQCEPRQLLAGVVNVDITVPGTIQLIGDGDDNQVVLRQTVDPNTYEVSRPAGDTTLFQLNGAGVTLPTITVNGINSDISVALGSGDDHFHFIGKVGGGSSDVPNDLIINNDHGSNKNTLTDLFIHGDLSVTKVIGTTGRSELTITGTTVIRDTQVDNTGGGTGGSTLTKIDSSFLQGDGLGNVALSLVNGSATDITEITGNTQFGTGAFISPLQPIVSINNGAGGSRTSFTGASNVAGPGTTTVYGDVSIDNAVNIAGTLDIVTFNRVNILGNVDVDNGHGTTQTVITDSTLGSYLKPTLSGPVTVTNGTGVDEFSMTNSQAPFGLFIDNGTGNWGSKTDIRDSRIGELLGSTVTGLEIETDDGNDTINLNGVTIVGLVDFDSIGNGTNQISIINRSSLQYLEIDGGVENDFVTINDSTIRISVDIRLGAGADKLELLNIDPATEWPSPLLGMIVLDGGLGVDTINVSPLTIGALQFELFV